MHTDLGSTLSQTKKGENESHLTAIMVMCKMPPGHFCAVYSVTKTHIAEAVQINTSLSDIRYNKGEK